MVAEPKFDTEEPFEFDPPLPSPFVAEVLLLVGVEDGGEIACEGLE